MPYGYVIDKERRLVISTGTGVVTLQEIEEMVARRAQDADFDPSFNELADLTQVAELRIDANEISQLAQYSSFSKSSRRAVVAGRAHIFGMSRMYELKRSNSADEVEPIQVFSDVVSAMEWLSLGTK